MHFIATVRCLYVQQELNVTNYNANYGAMQRFSVLFKQLKVIFAFINDELMEAGRSEIVLNVLNRKLKQCGR